MSGNSGQMLEINRIGVKHIASKPTPTQFMLPARCE